MWDIQLMHLARVIDSILLNQRNRTHHIVKTSLSIFYGKHVAQDISLDDRFHDLHSACQNTFSFQTHLQLFLRLGGIGNLIFRFSDQCSFS
jgi:hypothetical protein